MKKKYSWMRMRRLIGMGTMGFFVFMFSCNSLPVRVSAQTTMVSTTDNVTVGSASFMTLENEVSSLLSQIRQLALQVEAYVQSGHAGQNSGSANTVINTNGCYSFLTNLSVGSQGPDVTALQNFLITRGYLSIASATDYFGPLTESALRNYQTANTISGATYGSFDAATRSFVMNQCAGTTNSGNTNANSTSGTTTGTTTNSTSTLTMSGSGTFSAPQISSIFPSSGTAGSIITITGSNFNTSANTIAFSDGTNNSNIITQVIPSANGSTLSFTIPSTVTATSTTCTTLYSLGNCTTPLASGTYTITVTNTNGTSTPAAFNVTGTATSTASTTSSTAGITPAIISLSPATGTIGTSVTIFGTNFLTAGNTVNFDGMSFSNLGATNGNSITFNIPTVINGASVSPGSYTLSVSNADGTSNTEPFTVE